MEKRVIIVAPVGDYIDEIYIAVREFLAEKVILLSPVEQTDSAEKIKKDLEKFKVPVRIVKFSKVNTKAELWEEVFRSIAELAEGIGSDKMLIHVSTGDRETRCASTSAAFVNGVRAFAIDGQKPVMLPVLKFNYYKLISDKKMKLLKLLYDSNCCSSLEELSRKAGMSLPLISYHINGNLKSEGLKDLGLVETKENKGRMEVLLTSLGKMLLKGYIEPHSKK